MNYVFCRNWAVTNPAGTRLDSSSLVNKQVARVLDTFPQSLSWHPPCELAEHFMPWLHLKSLLAQIFTYVFVMLSLLDLAYVSGQNFKSAHFSTLNFLQQRYGWQNNAIFGSKGST